MVAVMAAAMEVAVAIDQTSSRSSFGSRAERPASSALTDAELSASANELFRQVRAEDAATMSEDEKRRKREQAEEQRDALCDIAIDGADMALSVARSRSAGGNSGGYPLRSEMNTTTSGDGFGFLSGSVDSGPGLGDTVSGIAGAVGDVVGGVVGGICDLLP
ncbi:MAG: hypothetical protein ACOYOJ_15535 [Alsobacter sp.]